MSLVSRLKIFFYKIKNCLRDGSFEGIIGIVNAVPKFCGFSITEKKTSVPFWILHWTLLAYVYGAGILVYLLQIADGFEDLIKCYVNVSILTLIINMSVWWMINRPLMLETLKIIKESDDKARNVEFLQAKQKKMLNRIKLIILTYISTNVTEAILIYIPNRADISVEYAMAVCVGMEPLTATPNHQICSSLLAFTELFIMAVVICYQALLFFLVAHTAAMYHLLAKELMSLDKFTDLNEIQVLARQRLPNIILRHSLILSTYQNLKDLYSVPIGVDFGSNAQCLALFFTLPFEQWAKYSPVLVYCGLSFLLYCFLGQKLTTASEVFERAVYSCGWENFDVKEKKLVYVMLRQAQKPVILLAAGIIPVNMYTFATTLQGMFKLVTVVKF